MVRKLSDEGDEGDEDLRQDPEGMLVTTICVAVSRIMSPLNLVDYRQQ